MYPSIQHPFIYSSAHPHIIHRCFSCTLGSGGAGVCVVCFTPWISCQLFAVFTCRQFRISSLARHNVNFSNSGKMTSRCREKFLHCKAPVTRNRTCNLLTNHSVALWRSCWGSIDHIGACGVTYAAVKALPQFFVTCTKLLSSFHVLHRLSRSAAAEEEHVRSAAVCLPFIHAGGTNKGRCLDSTQYGSISKQFFLGGGPVYFLFFIQNRRRMRWCLKPRNHKLGDSVALAENSLLSSLPFNAVIIFLLSNSLSPLLI